MDKIIIPADRVLAEIGRLALIRPWLSGVLLLAATLVTLISNNPFTSGRIPLTSNTSSIDIPSAPAADTAVALVDEATASVADDSTPTATATTATSATKTGKPLMVSTATKTTKKTSTNNAQINYVSGLVTHSLYSDARKAGLSTRQANQLVQLFSGKNLAQTMRSGDDFHVLYENPKIIKNKKYSGNILAAQITRNDKTYQLIRFADPKGRANYYTPQGQTLGNGDGLLRQPVQFTHISSGFSSNRVDPVLHYRRPHLGVDYAAPTGTPIKAAGDGVVAEMGYHGGYGKTIVIKHDDKYSTLYGHMSKYAELKTGDPVQQGQVIGYVGQTGFATGPHLHYEIHVNDVAYNPLTVALPGASIPREYRNQFLAKSKVLLAQLHDKRQQVQLAQNNQSIKRS